MPILSRRRQPFETLPDGSSVYEAIRRLSRGNQIDQPETKPDMPILSRGPISTTTPDPNASTITPRPMVEPVSRFPAPTDVSPEPLDRNVQPATPSLNTIGPPPVMMLTRDGHAVSATGGKDNLDSLQTLARTQEGEIPKRESKKMIALRTGLGFVFGGIPGAASTAVGDISDRRALDRGKINRNLANTEGQIGRELAVRHSQNTILNDQSKRELENAQAIRALREPLTREPGFTLGEGQIRYAADGKPIATGPAKTRSAKPPVKQADEQGNVYLADAETGEPLRDAQGGIRYSTRTKPPKPDESPKDYATRQRNFVAAQSKYKGLIEEEKAAATAKDQAYAAYSQAKARYPQNADIQPDVIAAKAEADRAQAHYATFWGKKDAAKAEMLQHGDGVGADGEPIAPKAVSPQRPVKPARDGKYHYTPDQIRGALKPGQTYENVLKQLSARPNVIIDQ